MYPLIASVTLCTVITLLSFIVRDVLYTLDAPPYTDSGFKYLSPDWSAPEYYPVYVNTVYISIFIAGTLYLILRNPFRWIILRRMCFLLSLAELIYFIQLSVTRFPDPNPALHGEAMLFDMYHVIYVTSFFIIQFYEYSTFLRAVYLPLALFGLWLLIPTHMFYTIDVMTAVFSVSCVFFIYHWYVRNAVAISKRRLLVWFESDALNLLLHEDEVYHKKLIQLASGEIAGSRHNHTSTSATNETNNNNSNNSNQNNNASNGDLPSLQFFSTGQAEFSVRLEVPRHLNNPLNVLIRNQNGRYTSPPTAFSSDDNSENVSTAAQRNGENNYGTPNNGTTIREIYSEGDHSMTRVSGNNNNTTSVNHHSSLSDSNNNNNTEAVASSEPQPSGHHRSQSGNHWVKDEHGFEVPATATLFNPFRSPSYLDAKIKADVFQRATERLVLFVRATYNDRQKWIHLFGVSALGGGLGISAGLANLGAVQLTDIERPIGVPLPRDIIFENLPKVWDHTADIFVYSLLALTGVLILFKKERFTIARRTGTLYFCIMILRVFTVTSTFPVDPSPLCKFREHPPGTTCGDLIFSGHTVALLLASLVWTDYFDNSYIRNAFVIAFVWIFCIVGLFMVVLSKLHYTRDVLTACVVVTSFYHMWQVSVFLRPDVLLRHSWLRWFELDQFIVMEQEGKYSEVDQDNNNNNNTTITTTVTNPSSSAGGNRGSNHSHGNNNRANSNEQPLDSSNHNKNGSSTVVEVSDDTTSPREERKGTAAVTVTIENHHQQQQDDDDTVALAQ